MTNAELLYTTLIGCLDDDFDISLTYTDEEDTFYVDLAFRLGYNNYSFTSVIKNGYCYMMQNGIMKLLNKENLFEFMWRQQLNG